MFPPYARGQPAPLAPLTDEQRRFAEEHHDLIYAFLGRGGYAAGEYYDAAALGFLQAVQRYLTQPWLRRYAFPTVAWRAMGRCVSSDYRAGERRRRAEQRYLEGTQPPPTDLLEERILLHDLLSAANGEQRRLIWLRLQGHTMPEAARAQGISAKQARRLLSDLHRAYSETERGFNFNE